MSKLTLVSDGTDSPGRRAVELMKEARAAGEQQVSDLLATLELACRQAAEIVAGGEVYPAGVRDIAAKLTEHTAFKAQAIYSIMRPPTERKPERPALVREEQPPVERSAADEAYAADFPDDEFE